MSVVDSDAERQTEPVQIHWGSRSDREGIEAPLQGEAGACLGRRLSGGSGSEPYPPCRPHGGSAGGSLQKRKPLQAPVRLQSVWPGGGAWPSPPRSMDWLARSSATSGLARWDRPTPLTRSKPSWTRWPSCRRGPGRAPTRTPKVPPAACRRAAARGRKGRLEPAAAQVVPGVAVAEPFKTYVAQVAEVTVDDRGVRRSSGSSAPSIAGWR